MLASIQPLQFWIELHGFFVAHFHGPLQDFVTPIWSSKKYVLIDRREDKMWTEWGRTTSDMDHSGPQRTKKARPKVRYHILTAFLSETMSYFSAVLILLTVLVVSDFVAVRVLVFTALVLVLDGRWRISDIFSNFIFWLFFEKKYFWDLRSIKFGN